eukprot:11211589-Lingulodinium_polyedra.AAC.1
MGLEHGRINREARKRNTPTGLKQRPKWGNGERENGTNKNGNRKNGERKMDRQRARRNTCCERG